MDNLCVMESESLHLEIEPFQVGLFKLPPSSQIPQWVFESSFYSITKTLEELSILCTDSVIPREIIAERNWSCFRLMGSIDFSTTGVLASLADPLARAGISIFSVSTFETDYLLVRKDKLQDAIACLEQAGHVIEN